MAALQEMGLHQMLIVDPMSIYYLTGVYVAPFERFYGLYLREGMQPVFFLNNLFTVPQMLASGSGAGISRHPQLLSGIDRRCGWLLLLTIRLWQSLKN